MKYMNKESWLWKIFYNAFRFVINVGFVLIFQILFGMENTLTGVAIGVGFTMLPLCNLDLKPWTMFWIIVFLYGGGPLIAQLSMINPWLAFVCDFLFLALIILIANEPTEYQTNITFLLCFVFSQSTVVSWEQFPMRAISGIAGGLFVGACVVLNWHRKGYGGQIGLRQQILRCQVNRSYLLRMSFGVSLAMLIGSLFHISKPLWISIVVMSLTQLEFSETLTRIKQRFIGTLVGVVIFFIFFQYFIPQQFASLFVMFLGYMGFFLPEYKFKQVINAISALNASLVILDTMTAIENRIFCLIAGIMIVLSIYLITKCVRHFHLKISDMMKRWADDFFKQLESQSYKMNITK
ncbi:FUSC family protein [Candidatus Stoquefichus massiliensis]|uniref:FUSC family protein n=1 Tax=Candidatus Stoquefichus massiliensis TaxID=1470350 RepID=UPI000489EBEE|nr:FUSC family protein [Candidatus Stoquefichus massiliensis]